MVRKTKVRVVGNFENDFPGKLVPQLGPVAQAGRESGKPYIEFIVTSMDKVSIDAAVRQAVEALDEPIRVEVKVKYLN